MKSLGMIETRGLLAAIESADVMLKAAEVTLVNRTLVGGGLVTIIVAGDVGAVKASVDAGISAVERLNSESLISSHVIPRPHGEVEDLFLTVKEALPTAHVNETVEDAVSEPEVMEVSSEPEENAEEAVSEPEVTAVSSESEETVKVEAPKDTDISVENYAQQYRDHLEELISRCGVEGIMKALGTQTVIKLRSIARDYKSELGMKSREVSDAGRERLLQSFKAYLEQKSEESNQQ